MTTKYVVSLLAILGLAIAGWTQFWWWNESSTLKLPGTVEIQEVRLASKIGGRVQAVHVREGQVCDAGTVLVEFEIPQLMAQRRQWESRLAAAEARWEKLKNGSRAEEIRAAEAQYAWAVARRDRVLAGPRPEELEQARGEVDRVQADIHRTRKELSRIEALRAEQIATASQYDELVAALQRSQGVLRTAQARLRELELGSRQEDIAEAEADVARLRAQADLVRAGPRQEDIREAEAAVLELRSKLEELAADIREGQLIAPSRVLIEVVAVRPGDVVPPHQPVVRVLRSDDLWIKAFVPETQLGRVRLNQTVEVTIDSYPGRRFHGTIFQIATVSEFTPRNVQSADERRHQVFGIKVRVEDPDGIFKAGMAAEVLIPLKD
jgi:multidrug resistance efflux pump